MRTTTLTLLALANPSFMMAQRAMDTLFANERQIHSLFFESPIEKGIVGASNFAFTFNREKSENLGLLQARKGSNSNLLVLTKDGSIYSFVVVHKEELATFTTFVKSTSTLTPTTIKKQPLDSTDVGKKANKDYKKLCRQLLGRTTKFQQIYFQKGIRLRVTESVYYGNEVYIVYEIKNTSAIDYEVERLRLLKVLGTKTKKSSHQELPIQPLYRFQFPKKVFQGNSLRFVVVYPKFTLGDQERLKVLLQEKNGSRNFEIKIK